MIRTPNFEKETIILTTEADDFYDIYTFNPSLMRKLRKFACLHPDFCRLTYADGDRGAERYTVAKSRVSIRLNAPISEGRKKELSRQAKERFC